MDGLIIIADCSETFKTIDGREVCGKKIMRKIRKPQPLLYRININLLRRVIRVFEALQL